MVAARGRPKSSLVGHENTGHRLCTAYHLQGETKITVRNNGPLRIEGEFTIYDMEGKAFDLAGRTAISLCRCGHSANKPFCDSSHKTVGFQSVVQACQLPPPPEPKPPGA